MLVLLRVNIGWHFFSEGMSHYTDSKWSSAPVLRAAKGPLAPVFGAYLPEYRDLETLNTAADPDAADAWVRSIADRMTAEENRYADFYHFDDDQKAASQKLLGLRQKQTAEWGVAHKEDLAAYLHERERLKKAKAEPSARTVPYQKKRIADKEIELSGQARGWVSQLQGIEEDFRAELASLRTDEQGKRGPIPQQPSSLQKVDTMMTYGILGIGVCLLVGLFTRLACVLGAAFLFSVVLTQPFWVSDAQPTFNQWVELFALLTLATTNVGKWGGLDFFISCLFGGCCKGKCENRDRPA